MAPVRLEIEKRGQTVPPVESSSGVLSERREVPQVGREVEGYLEKAEKEPQPVVSDDGSPLLTTQNSQQVTVTLPLSDEQIRQGLHQKVYASFYWLSIFCKRIIAKAGRMGLKIIYPKI